MSDEVMKLPADYGIAVGTEWIDDDEGEIVTVTGIDDPSTMYPIAFRWNDGHEGADDVDGFCASFRPRDWTALAASEAAARAESASLRERLAMAETEQDAQLSAALADTAALREQLADVTESQTYWQKSSEDWSRQMAEARNQLRTAEALVLANGERVTRADALLKEVRGALAKFGLLPHLQRALYAAAHPAPAVAAIPEGTPTAKPCANCNGKGWQIEWVEVHPYQAGCSACNGTGIAPEGTPGGTTP